MSITAVDKSFLTALWPEFAAVDENRLPTLNTIFMGMVSEGVFGDKSRFALACLIAHHLAQPAGGGLVQSQSAGDLSRAYHFKANWSSLLQLTKYGLQYLELVRICNGGTILYTMPGDFVAGPDGPVPY